MSQFKFALKLLLYALPGLLLWYLTPHDPWGPLLAGGLPLGAGGVLDQKAMQALATWDGGNFSSQAVTTSFTATVTQLLQGSQTWLILTGAPGAGFNVTTPTAQQLVQQYTNAYGAPPAVGSTWAFEIVNQGTGQTATLVGGTGVTITGTATVATATTRTWLCTFTNNTNSSAAAVTMQNIASRTGN